MSQDDCLGWLKEQKKNEWFRVKDVQDGLRLQGKGSGTIKNVATHLLILTNWGEVKMRGVGVWKHYKEFKLTG